MKMPKLPAHLVCPQILKSLGSCNIYSVSDFLQADFEKLITPIFNEKEIIEFLQQFVCNYSAIPKDALILYQHLLRKTSIIQTFINGLDDLLNGGLLTGTLLEICGLSGAGKTQICLTIILNVVLKMKSHVTYIDTKRDFCFSRLLQILQTRNNTEEVDTVLERINIIQIDDIHKLLTFLHSIKNVSDSSSTFGKLIVIDSLAVLFFPLIGLPNNQCLSLLNHAASLLKIIAVEHHIAIILTNPGSKFEDGLDVLKSDDLKNVTELEIKPSLGKYWLHVPNTRLIVSKSSALHNERVLMVKKSDYIKLGNKCTVSLENRGVSLVPPWV